MARKSIIALVCAVLFTAFAPQTVSAQYGLCTPKAAAKTTIKKKATPVQRLLSKKEFEKSHPVVCSIKNKLTEASLKKSPLKSANVLKSAKDLKNLKTAQNLKASKAVAKAGRTATRKTPLMRTADGRELWGNVVYSAYWEDTECGLYKFNASDPVNTESMWINEDCAANGGGALVGDEFHIVNYYMSDDFVYMSHTCYNAETGEILSENGLTDFSLIATDLAVAYDGTVYGEFFNSNLNGFELGIMDYSTLTRSTIGTLSNHYVALGVTKDKELYGVAADGNLYKIDSNTASETLVGPTGLTLLSEEDNLWGQSGEIDYKTGVFYWASMDANGNSALYTVDLTSGALDLVGNFYGSEQIYALSVPKPAAEDDAPAAIDDLNVSFKGASLTGKATFTAPSKTFAGGELTGELTYSIESDGEVLASGTTTPGATVEADITVTASGSYDITAATTNSIGRSPLTTTSTYVGFDVPYPVTDITVSPNTATGEVTISWTAPTEGENGGYIGDLTYNVIRQPEGVEVAHGISGTTYTDTITSDELQAYYYDIVVVNGDVVGNDASSTKAVIGPAIVPPYDNDFADASSLDLMTIIDANNDWHTWDYHYEQGCAYNVYSDVEADDWLLTPVLKLEAGKEYTVSFTASNTIEEYTERLEVKYGEGDDPTLFTGTLLQPTELTGQKEYFTSIVPTKDMNARIGFHAISDPEMFNLLLRGVHVSAGSDMAAPDSVSNFKVTPDNKGGLMANISFNIPTKNVGGTTLSEVTKAEIYRDGELRTTISEGLTPGSAVSYNDSVDTDATYSYKTVLYNTNGIGRYARTVSKFVGTDMPERINAESIVVKDNSTSIDVTWDAVAKGANGGYVNPEEITYKLYDGLSYDDWSGYEYGDLLTTVKGESKATIEKNTEEGDQDLLTVCIQPSNEKGLAMFSAANSIIVGENYTIPFKETFDYGQLAYSLWWTNTPGSSSWFINGDLASAEGATGAAVFDGCNDSSSLCTGKIAPAGANNLKLYFSTQALAGFKGSMAVQIQKKDGTIEDVDSVSIDATGLAEGETTAWQTHSMSLAKYANEPYIVVRFVGNSQGNGYCFLDNIQIRDVKAHDLAVGMTAPEKMKKGLSSTVSVKVTNYGDKVAEGYTVRLLEGDKVIADSIGQILEPVASATYEMCYTPSIFNEGDSVVLTAEVIYAADLDTDNNKTTATVQTTSSTKPAPTDVKTKRTDGIASISWTAPDTTPKTVTEGFEDYDTWATSFGDWTTYDGDKGYTGGVFNNYQYGHQGEPFAFEVFEPTALFDDILETNPEMAAHSGNKYVAAMYSGNEDGVFDADNWLISPSLSGKQQTITFYAHNQGDGTTDYEETIELLYSKSGTDVESFESIKTVTISNGEWKEVTFDVPEGAAFFAIHHISTEGGFMLSIDDVTYTAGAGTLTGYNIYRNGEFFKHVDANTLTFTDATADGSNYAVTAVYTDGESAPALATETDTSIEDIEALTNGVSVKVYTVDGKFLGEGAKVVKSLHKGVYVINGQKVTVK